MAWQSLRLELDILHQLQSTIPIQKSNVLVITTRDEEEEQFLKPSKKASLFDRLGRPTSQLSVFDRLGPLESHNLVVDTQNPIHMRLSN